MFCIKCGKEIPDGAKFCPSCGQEVNGKVEEKVEQKSEKNIWKQGKKLPIWKKILIVLAAIVAFVVGNFIVTETWILAEIPHPEDFFGLEAQEANGGSDTNWYFYSDEDPLPIIEKYINYIEGNVNNIEIKKDEWADGDIFYDVLYEGFWLAESKMMLRIVYNGYVSDYQKYRFLFRVNDNFKLVESECYAGDVSVDEIVNNNTPNNSQSESKEESEKESEKVEVNPFALPDPCLFFNCGRHEDQKYENGDAWLVSCKFDLDEGQNVVQEYIDLLESQYPLKKFDEYEEDYTRSSAKYFFRYFYRYTGEEEIQGFERDDRENTDVYIGISCDFRKGTILLTIIHDNTFELVDCGEKASAIPTSYSGSPSNSGSNNSGSDYKQPEYTKLDCTFCHNGDCPKCNGYGTVEYYNGNGEYIDTSCPDCRGSGDCRRCGGTGKRDN